MKDTKCNVAVVLKKQRDGDEFLVVHRPAGDKDLAGSWVLPAVTLLSGELPEEGAVRACREKLGCVATPVRFLGVMYQKRSAYVGQQWTQDPMVLMESARHGSCCASIFLIDRGCLIAANGYNPSKVPISSAS